MGSWQIYKGTQSFALYWVGGRLSWRVLWPPPPPLPPPHRSSRLSAYPSVSLSFCCCSHHYTFWKLKRFILLRICFGSCCFFFVDVVVVGFLWLFELFLIYGNAKVFCCKMRSTFLLLRSLPLPLSSSASSHSSSFSYTLEWVRACKFMYSQKKKKRKKPLLLPCRN